MSDPGKKKATYKDLNNIPEHMTGEIIGGELIVTPRPSRKHTLATSLLASEIIPPYYHGRGGGPGGWVILIEPEIKLGEDILFPDLAGWKKERFPIEEPHNWISVSPDWICEMLSSGSCRVDRIDKMPVYAQYGVTYLWLVDPLKRTLEVFQLREGELVMVGLYKGNAGIRAVPFAEIEIHWSDLFPGRPA